MKIYIGTLIISVHCFGFRTVLIISDDIQIKLKSCNILKVLFLNNPYLPERLARPSVSEPALVVVASNKKSGEGSYAILSAPRMSENGLEIKSQE